MNSETQEWRVSPDTLKEQIIKEYLNSVKQKTEPLYIIEMTTKLRCPEQKTFYIKSVGIDDAARPTFSNTKNIEKAGKFRYSDAIYVRRILEMSQNKGWMPFNYAVVEV